MILAFSSTILLQTTTKALALGSLYALLALGFVLIFKATQTINFAQGALALLGGWILSMLFIDNDIPARWMGGPTWLHWFIAVAIAVALTAVVGLVIERLTIRPMIGEPIFSIAVITLGLEIVIRTVGNDAVNVTPRNLGVPWRDDGFGVGDAFIAWTYVADVIVAAVAFLAVFLFFRTRMGIAMRATAFDQEAAMAQGISVGRVFAIAWGSGAALACLAGVFASAAPWPSSGTVTRDTAFFAFRALPAVILGGLDSVTGAMAGGLIIGFAEIFSGEYLSGHTATLGAGYQQVIPYIVMLVALLFRPYGLFGTKEIRRV